jgi:hypothetical protein
MSDATWLKIMANGALGEARVRALLLERFHVLTRSVDADGADFLIQLPSSGRFSDELAPRLGIIQVKFAQDETTNHLVAVDYAVAAGQVIDEFFVLVTMGHEDGVKNYLLSAQDLSKVARTTREGKEYYSLTAKIRKPYYQKSVTKMLDAIETNLRERTKQQNEQFYQKVSIPNFNFKRASLDKIWLWPIPNEAGFIPDLIYQLRISLRTQLYALDEFTAAVTKLLTSKKADECAASVKAIIEDRTHQISGRDEFLRIGPFQIVDLEAKLVKAIKIHEDRIGSLRTAGQFNRYIFAANEILKEHLAFSENHMEPRFVQVDKDRESIATDHARTTVTLDPSTLDVMSVVTDLVPKGSYDKVIGKSQIIRSRELWRYAASEGTIATWRELDRLTHLLLADLFQLMVPESSIGNLVLPLWMTE